MTKSPDDIFVVYNKRNLEFHSRHNDKKSARVAQSKAGEDYLISTERNYRIHVEPRRVYFQYLSGFKIVK